ncbi:MAG: hypothetical protein ACPG7F_19545 [Aggregatilineales bacterium]
MGDARFTFGGDYQYINVIDTRGSLYLVELNSGGNACAAVYAWLQVLFISEGVDSIYGEIFDFRQVEEFSPDNLMNARQKSRTMNLRMDTRRLPVAMVVNDVFQEQILRGPMRNVPENPRKRIVETIEDAHAFLHEWHELNNTEAS